MIVSMENGSFQQLKGSDSRRDSGIGPQTFEESLPPALCDQLEKDANSGTLNLSQSSYLSDISVETDKANGIPSVKEMIRRREMMTLKPSVPLPQTVLAKTSPRVETPEMKVKLIVQRFESCLQDDDKSDAGNRNALPKSEDRKTRSCSKLPSFLKHSLSYMNDSNSYYSDSCPSFMNSLANNISVAAAATPDSTCQQSFPRRKLDAVNQKDKPLQTNECRVSKHNALSSSSISSSVEDNENSVKCDIPGKTPPEKGFTTKVLSRQNLLDLEQQAKSSVCSSKHSNENLSTDNSYFDSFCDNSLNGMYEIEVYENSKSNLNVRRMSQDSDCKFVDHANNSWLLPKKDNGPKFDCHNNSHGTSLYKLVKSMSEDAATPTTMRRSSVSSSVYSRNFNSSGSQASSSPVETRPKSESPRGCDETVSTKWILEQLQDSCPGLDFYNDPNEVCTVSKLQDVFEDLKTVFSSKKDSDKNMICLFRENRSAMRLIRKQAKELEERYNQLQWKSVYSNQRLSELTNRHQEALELEDLLNVRLANIQEELPDGVWLPPSRSLSGMLEGVLEGESLLLSNKYKRVIADLHREMKLNLADRENGNKLDRSALCLQCPNHIDHMSEFLVKEKEELQLKEEISALYNEIKKINSERNHLLIANKTLHHELQLSHNKISHFERDICAHLCQHKEKLNPQNSRDCNYPRHSLEIQELRNQLEGQSYKMEQQSRNAEFLRALINAIREVLHHQEYQIKSIPGVCKLLKMIAGEINPSSVVLEAAVASPWF